MAAAEASYNEQVAAASKTAAELIGAAGAAYTAAMDAADAAYDKAFEGPDAAYQAKAARAAEEYAASMKSAEESYRTDTEDAYQGYLAAIGPAAANAATVQADADAKFDKEAARAVDERTRKMMMSYMGMSSDDPAAVYEQYVSAIIAAFYDWYGSVSAAWGAYAAVAGPAYDAYCNAFE